MDYSGGGRNPAGLVDEVDFLNLESRKTGDRPESPVKWGFSPSHGGRQEEDMMAKQI